MKKNLTELNISKEFFSFLDNLSEKAEKKDRIPFIGRNKEIEAVMESLLRKFKNNLLLIGKPGVGKTALITEIASLINKGKVPKYLKEKIILELSMNAFLYSRDSVKNLIKDFEQLIGEIKESKDKIIFFLDEMQMQSIVGAGKRDQFGQFQSLLKSHIVNRELSIIAATTPENYYKYIKNDEILSQSFSPILIDEPGKKEMLEILKGVKPYFESYYSLRIPESLFEKIFFLAQKFIPHRAFPHKAIDLLDISCSKVSLKKAGRLSINFVYNSVGEISKLPIEIVKKDPYKHSKGILGYLRAKIVNQENALEEIARIIKLSRLETDIESTKPEGIFLFLGPTGVGKSFIAKKIAEYLFGSEEKLRIINLGEFKRPEDIRKLIGDNKTDSGILIKEVENHPFSVILFENIAMAHSLILTFLGKVLSKGNIIDAFGKKYHLSNIIFVLNLTRIGEEKKEISIGFIKGDKINDQIIIPTKIMNVLDWVDEIIEFSTLSENQLKRIATEKLKNLKGEIKKKYQIDVKVSNEALNFIAKRAFKEGSYAHSVGEIIEREIRIKVLDLITRKGTERMIAVDSDSKKIKLTILK